MPFSCPSPYFVNASNDRNECFDLKEIKLKTSYAIRGWAGVVTVLFVLFCTFATAAETQPTLSKKELKTLLATAHTAADHQKIAAYYHEKAQRLNAKAQEFSAQADILAKQPATIESKQGISCNCTSHFRYFAKQYAQEAQESETLAAQHEKISQEYLAKQSEQK
jgi:hypothetical protein